MQGVDQIVTKYSPVARNSQLKEADDQLTGSFAATTAESKLSELCRYLQLYISTNLRKENEIPLFRKFPFS